ncbi:MAG: cell division protein FtsZ [Bacteroidota bacterium]|nr:cell division protein FtsZ [Bacteroidota bacterium]
MNYFKVELPKEQSSIIKVMGVGGGGSNAVNYMYDKGIVGVDFFLCNTDAQHLEKSNIKNKIQLGSGLTEGLGAGGDPEFGKRCAMESINQIEEALKTNTKMLFVTAGMGGGTGTGAAPVIAQKAKQMGILTVGIVTKPFKNEGPLKAQKAEKGIEDLKPHVDALLVINNERIIEMYSNLRIRESLSKADDILFTAVKGIAEIITVEGYMNVDFRDVKTALQNSGRAIMGTGVSTGDNRALNAVQMALDSPLLDQHSIEGAEHILLNICFGKEEPYTNEISAICEYLQLEAGKNANLKYGLTKNDLLEDELAVTVVATGFENKNNERIIFETKYNVEPEMEPMDDDNGFLDIDFTISNPINEKPVVEVEIPVDSGLPKPNFQYNDFSSNDLNVPAYKRHQVKFEEALPGVDISNVYLEEEKDNKGPRFKEGGNKYLHDNVD